MNRIFALLLVLCLLLAGCMEPVTTTEPTQSAIQPTASTSAAPDAPTQAPTEPATEGAYVEPPAACENHRTDPYENVDKEAFYASYTTACCYADATYRTAHFLMSGSLEVPGQYAQAAGYRPMDGTQYIHNTNTWYENDGNTYVVVDGFGREVLRIYKGAAYITLEEVAAYIYAFGGSNDTLPANYTSKKNTKPQNSPWGEYLRLNHSYFSGDTYKYPYEPELPNISGCGGSAQYYEMDVGTTGTYTGPGYPVKLYNDGNIITRGAARIVYTRQDRNGNGIYETDEVFLFYTANHYNDFREYLNYFGGWGEIFGNETGGGKLSDKNNCNPTPYVPTGYASFPELKKQG